MPPTSTPFEAKVVFLGESGVGKTTIISVFAHDEYSEEHAPTIGAHFSLQRMKLGDDEIRLKIWDTAGQERFRALTPMYYRDSHVAVLVFSVDQQESFDGLASWIEALKRDTQSMPALIIVGNKVDLEPVVSAKTCEAFAEENGATYAECSALTKKGIEELFVLIAQNGMKAKSSKVEDEGHVQQITGTKKQKSGCC
jgi:small GTP-binding protein